MAFQVLFVLFSTTRLSDPKQKNLNSAFRKNFVTVACIKVYMCVCIELNYFECVYSELQSD